MAITFDPVKSERDRVVRDLPFDVVRGMVWTEALIGIAKTQEPTSTRFHAVGPIRGEVYVVIFTFEGNGIRVISVRRAQRKEERLWRSVRTPS